MPQCARCKERVGADVRNCPHCGYDASERGRKRARAVWWIGVLFCLTIVGAVVGIPIILIANFMSGKADARTVGEPAA